MAKRKDKNMSKKTDKTIEEIIQEVRVESEERKGDFSEETKKNILKNIQ